MIIARFFRALDNAIDTFLSALIDRLIAHWVESDE